MSNRHRKPKGRAKKLKKLKENQGNQSNSSSHNEPSRNQVVTVNVGGQVALGGEIRIAETEDAAKQHLTDRTQDNSRYKEHTRGYEQNAIILSGLTLAVTTAYFIVTLGIFNETKRAANISKEGVDVSRNTLIASERPWMMPRTDVGDLTFGKDGAASIVATYSLNNVGHSPAVKVGAGAILYMTKSGLDAQDKRNEICRLANKAGEVGGQTIFAGDHTNFQGSLRVSQEDIKKSVVIPNFVTPSVIICIAYQSTLEKEWHYTGVIYDIRGINTMVKIGDRLPRDKMQFTYSTYRPIITYEEDR